jgi:hypothetical protein
MRSARTATAKNMRRARRTPYFRTQRSLKVFSSLESIISGPIGWHKPVKSPGSWQRPTCRMNGFLDQARQWCNADAAPMGARSGYPPLDLDAKPVPPGSNLALTNL